MGSFNLQSQLNEALKYSMTMRLKVFRAISVAFFIFMVTST